MSLKFLCGISRKISHTQNGRFKSDFYANNSQQACVKLGLMSITVLSLYLIAIFVAIWRLFEVKNYNNLYKLIQYRCTLILFCYVLELFGWLPYEHFPTTFSFLTHFKNWRIILIWNVFFLEGKQFLLCVCMVQNHIFFSMLVLSCLLCTRCFSNPWKPEKNQEQCQILQCSSAWSCTCTFPAYK